MLDLRGWQKPPIFSLPENIYRSLGEEATALAASCGLFLDPWQRWLLDISLGITDKYAVYPSEHEKAGCPIINMVGNPIYSWSAYEVGIMVSRQNGKGSFLEARELAGLFILREEVIVHSAHEFKTSMKHMARMEKLIRANPDLWAEIQSVRRSNGSEGITLKTGQELNFSRPVISTWSSSIALRPAATIVE